MRVFGLACAGLLASALVVPARVARAEEPAPAAIVKGEKAKLGSSKEPHGGQEQEIADRERQTLKREIETSGLVAIVRAMFADVKTPSDWAGRSDRAPAEVSAPMWRASVDDSFGAGGLQLSSAGEERGPTSIGAVNEIGTIGHGFGVADVGAFDGGRGHIQGTHLSGAPMPRAASLARVRIPPEAIQRVVRQSFGRFLVCYESALRTSPALHGRVAVKFTIDPSGEVGVASDVGSDLPDPAVVSCVVRGFATLTFPGFDAGTVTVVYPLAFTPRP